MLSCYMAIVGVVNVFLNRVKEKNCEVFTMPRPKKKGFIAFERYINRVINQGSYDAVHCHITGWEGLFFSVACKRHGVKNYIIHSHYSLTSSALDRTTLVHKINQYINYKTSNAYMTCSDLAADYVFGERYLKNRKAILIPNGIKSELYNYKITEEDILNYRKEFQLENNQRIIGHVGRFNSIKNHEFIIELAEKIKSDDYVFLLVGSGERLAFIQKMISDKNLEKRVRIIGRRNDIEKLMQFFDIVLLPSFREGLPTVAVECQAAGTPIVITDTITKQCDMHLGLVKFLSLDNVNGWIEEIKKEHKKIDIDKALSQIVDMGFTAETAGRIYCNELRRLISISK